MLNKHKWYLGLTGKVVILSSLLSGCGGGSDEPDPQPAPPPPANIAPVANAGGDISADEYETVELSAASSTDSDGSIASFLWEQTSGTPVSLSATNTSEVSFAAPEIDEDETLTFTLTVTDNDNSSATDTIEVQVVNNLAPTIEIDTLQSVSEMSEVSISATAADSDGEVASYLWTQTAGTLVEISEPSGTAIQFTAPEVQSDETLGFELQVTDDDGDVTVKVVNLLITNTITSENYFGEAAYEIDPNTGTFVDFASADIDGDGDMDIVYATPVSITWLEFDDNNYSVAGSIGADGGNFVKVEDIDGDGDMDVYSSPASNLYVHLNDGNGNFTTLNFSVAQEFFYSVVTARFADMDGNGTPDIVIGGQLNSTPSATGLYIYYSSALNVFDSGMRVGTTGNRVYELELDDFDGDGLMDIVYIDNANDAVNIITQNSNNTFDPEVTIANVPSPYRLIKLTNSEGNYKLLVSSGEGLYTVDSNGAVLQLSSGASSLIDTADINNDGSDDILASDYTNNTYMYFEAQADGNYAEGVTLLALPEQFTPRGIMSNDVDADGDWDIIVSHGQSAQLEIYLNSLTSAPGFPDTSSECPAVLTTLHNPDIGSSTIVTAAPPQELPTSTNELACADPISNGALITIESGPYDDAIVGSALPWYEVKVDAGNDVCDGVTGFASVSTIRYTEDRCNGSDALLTDTVSLLDAPSFNNGNALCINFTNTSVITMGAQPDAQLGSSLQWQQVEVINGPCAGLTGFVDNSVVSQ